MQQLMYVEPGRLEWEDAAEPQIQGPKEALVRPIAVANCDLDSAIIRGMVPLFQGPYPFGHEGVAEVVEVGEDVTGFNPGDLVVVPFQISCGECDPCNRGSSGNCREFKRPMYGFGVIGGDWGGFMSDLVRVPFADAMLVKVSSTVDPRSIASMSDNIPDAWRTVGPQLLRQPGSPVVIIAGGAPSIGLYAVLIASAMGAASIHYLDTDQVRLQLAESFGAAVHEGPPPRRLGRAPITVDASASPEGLACAIRSTEPDGICTSIGIYYSDTTPVPLLDMYVAGVSFHTGRPHARASIPEILDLVEKKTLKPELVTTKLVSWEDAPAALADPPTKLVMVRKG